MIEFLNDIDAQAFGAINMCHGAYADNFMWLVSNRLAWGLMGLTFVLLLARKGWRCALLTLAAVALAVLVADQVSSSLIKHAVERLRPSHDPSLADTVHIVRQYRGGLYGFVSSHAANSVAVGLLLGLMLRDRVVLTIMMCWALLQCYSRVYLGVHYPGDIWAAFSWVPLPPCSSMCPGAGSAAVTHRCFPSVSTVIWWLARWG